MKFSKIILGSAILAMAMGFVSCSDDDDPYNMISGSNNHYSINHTNDTDQVQRGISSTVFKHAGGTLIVSFDTVNSTYEADATGGKRAGVMGIIFDLEEENGKKNFCVIGMRSKGKNSADIDYYVSRYENVTDLQASNFGATTSATVGEPKETVVIPAFNGNFAGTLSNGIASVLVYITQEAPKNENDKTTYKVYLLDPATKLNSDGIPVDEDGKTPLDLTSATPAASVSSKSNTQITDQKKLSVYANVYQGQTLVGNWDYQGTYKQVSLEE